ncbi:dienelactone hydrolase [Bradyrhizobium sp. LB1.3]
MRLLNTLVLLPLLALLTAPPLCAQVTFGSSGAEGDPFRRQQWRVPSPGTDIAAHALLFRPPGAGPFRLAVIAHASTQNGLRRAQMPQPEYRALTAFLIARGFAVLVPERLGHGATGGRYAEDQGGCDEADYARSGRATADAISLALEDLRKQDFIREDAAIVIGHSAGGWGALAFANADPKAISAIIAFAPGRGGHANDEPNRICAPQTLLAAARLNSARPRASPSRGSLPPMTAILHRHSRKCWSTHFAAAAARSISAPCRPPAARGTGRSKPRPASKPRVPNSIAH